MKGKKLLGLLPLALLSTSLIGCGGGGSGKTKIVFWHTMGQNLQSVLDRMIEGFKKENPNIEIEHAAQGGYDDLYDKISQAIPAGTTPTMAYCYPDHVADYNTSKACIDLTSYINDPELGFNEQDGAISDFIDAYWKEGQEYLTEGIFSVPYTKSTELMFYNKDVFDQKGYTVPETWEDMEVLLAKMKADYPDVTPLGYDSDANMFITLCEQYGIPYTSLDKAAGKGKADFNNAAAKAMVTKLKDWYDKGYLATQGTSGGAYTSTQFTDGTLLMTIGSTGGTGYNYTANFNVGSAQVPHPTTDASKRFDFFTNGGTKTQEANNHIIMQGPSICFFKKGTEAQKVAAWKFYKYIVRTINSAAFSVESGYSPVRKSSFTCDAMTEYLNKPQTEKAALIQTTVKMYGELTDRYYVSPAFPGSSTARSEVGGILSNVFLDTKTVDKAFADAYTKTNFAIQ